MPPGSSPRGRGNFQAFMAGGRQDFDGGRGNGMFRCARPLWSLCACMQCKSEDWLSTRLSQRSILSRSPGWSLPVVWDKHRPDCRSVNHSQHTGLHEFTCSVSAAGLEPAGQLSGEWRAQA